MAGINWTYGQIRNYVQGSGCTRGDDRIQVMTVACLQELWTKVCDDPFYADTLEVTLAEGESKVDISTCATISTIKVRYLDDDGEERCRTLSPQTLIPQAKNCGCDYTGDDDSCEHDVKGLPSEFTIVGDELCVFPCPDQEVTIDIECFREVNCELYTIDDSDPDAPVMVWNDVDLPERYQAQLANLLLSKFYAEEGDFAAATYWEQKVSTGLDSLLDKRANRYDPDADNATSCAPAEFKMIRRGSDKGCNSCGHSKCACHPGTLQTIYVDRLVDCDGNVVDPLEPEVDEFVGGKQ